MENQIYDQLVVSFQFQLTFCCYFTFFFRSFFFFTKQLNSSAAKFSLPYTCGSWQKFPQAESIEHKSRSSVIFTHLSDMANRMSVECRVWRKVVFLLFTSFFSREKRDEKNSIFVIVISTTWTMEKLFCSYFLGVSLTRVVYLFIHFPPLSSVDFSLLNVIILWKNNVFSSFEHQKYSLFPIHSILGRFIFSW